MFRDGSSLLGLFGCDIASQYSLFSSVISVGNILDPGPVYISFNLLHCFCRPLPHSQQAYNLRICTIPSPPAPCAGHLRRFREEQKTSLWHAKLEREGSELCTEPLCETLIML